MSRTSCVLCLQCAVPTCIIVQYSEKLQCCCTYQGAQLELTRPIMRDSGSLINALSSSVVPVLYSFLILLLLASVYAVMASDLFGQYDEENFGVFSRSASLCKPLLT